MESTVLEFAWKLCAACAGVGLLLNWVPLVRSFKGNDVPEHAPMIGILMWATLVPISVFCWLSGLPQFPIRIGGIVVSTALLLGCTALVTAMGWRLSKLKISAPLTDGAHVSGVRAWASASAMLIAAWIVMANVERLI